jgi:hypothetical protein
MTLCELKQVQAEFIVSVIKIKNHLFYLIKLYTKLYTRFTIQLYF